MVRGISLQAEMGYGFFFVFWLPTMRGTNSLPPPFFFVPLGTLSFGLSLAFPFFVCLLCDGSDHQSFIGFLWRVFFFGLSLDETLLLC